MSVVEFSADSWQASSPGLAKGIGARSEAVTNLVQGLEALASSKAISGRGADGMRAYIREVHLPIAQCLLLALQTFNTAIGVYWQGYSQVDTDGNFRLVADEFDSHVARLDSGMRRLRGFGRELRSISASAAHVVSLGGAGAHEVGSTVEEFERARTIAKTLHETWIAYEARDPGFSRVQELLGELKTTLGDLGTLTVGQGRDYTPGSFGPSLSRLGVLAQPMVEYCQENQKVASDGWQALFDGYVEDVKAREEQERKDRAPWEMVWDGVQVLAGAVVTVAGLGLAPFSGGFSLGLTALGGAMVIGGANSFINHASWAATGQELNLIGNASGAVGRWYDVHVARPAAGSGNWGRQFLAGLGGGAIDMVSGTLQLNVKEIGVGLGTLATSGQARERLWAGVSGFAGKLGQGDAFAWGQLTANLVPFAGGAAKLVKAGGAGGVAGVLGRVRGGVVSSAQDMKAVLGGAKSVLVSTVHDVKSVLTSVKSGLGGVRDRFLAGINGLAERTNQLGPGVRLATAGAGVPAGAGVKGRFLAMTGDAPKGHPSGSGGVGGGGSFVPRLSPGDRFSAFLRGEKITVAEFAVKPFDYVRRPRLEAAKLRSVFNGKVRSRFLKELAGKEDYLRRLGFNDEDLDRMRKGLAPKGYEVHHKHPLDDSGTNDFDNLILIKSDPYHKLLTRYQIEITKGLDIGAVRAVAWPEVPGDVFTGGVR